MDSFKNSMGRVVSIKVVKGSQLSEAVRGKSGIKSDEFAEIRVTRNSPAKPNVSKINGPPSSGFISAIENSNLVGFQFE